MLRRDANPLDYNAWGYVESKACKDPHPSVPALQRVVDKTWSELLTEEHVKKTCSVFWDRVKMMVDAKGCTFEPKQRKREQAMGRGGMQAAEAGGRGAVDTDVDSHDEVEAENFDP